MTGMNDSDDSISDGVKYGAIIVGVAAIAGLVYYFMKKSSSQTSAPDELNPGDNKEISPSEDPSKGASSENQKQDSLSYWDRALQENQFLRCVSLTYRF